MPQHLRFEKVSDTTHLVKVNDYNLLLGEIKEKQKLCYEPTLGSMLTTEYLEDIVEFMTALEKELATKTVNDRVEFSSLRRKG